MRRAMSAPQPVGPLISMFQPGQDMADNALHGKINWDAILGVRADPEIPYGHGAAQRVQ